MTSELRQDNAEEGPDGKGRADIGKGSSLSVVSKGPACLRAWPERHGARGALHKDADNSSGAEGIWERQPGITSISRLYYLISVCILNFPHRALHSQTIKTFSKTRVSLSGSS